MCHPTIPSLRGGGKLVTTNYSHCYQKYLEKEGEEGWMEQEGQGQEEGMERERRGPETGLPAACPPRTPKE